MPVLTIASATRPGGIFRGNGRFWMVEEACNLGIDPATTVADRGGRPMALLDEREPIREVI